MCAAIFHRVPPSEGTNRLTCSQRRDARRHMLSDSPGPNNMTGSLKWWQQGASCQLLVRSILDTDGDRRWDLRGVMQRSDYLHWLGGPRTEVGKERRRLLEISSKLPRSRVETLWRRPRAANLRPGRGRHVPDCPVDIPGPGRRADRGHPLSSRRRGRGRRDLKTLGARTWVVEW